MKKAYYKLVRDKIPEYLKSIGKESIFRILNENEFERNIFLKLKEEVDELFESRSEPDKAIKEIADIYEVLEALADNYGITQEVVMRIKQKKKEEKGGFKKKIFLEVADE